MITDRALPGGLNVTERKSVNAVPGPPLGYGPVPGGSRIEPLSTAPTPQTASGRGFARTWARARGEPEDWHRSAQAWARARGAAHERTGGHAREGRQ